MHVDSVSDLRRWASDIEVALGITISSNENGAFALCTQGGAMVGIEAAPKMHALVLTGQIGTADEAMSARSLRALLALNMAAGLSGTGTIGLAPENNALLIRLIWTPHESAWTQEDFVAVLTAFSEHVDALSASLVNGEIEVILGPPHDNSPSVDTAQFA